MICMQLQLSELLEGPRDIFRRFSGGLGLFVGQLRMLWVLLGSFAKGLINTRTPNSRSFYGCLVAKTTFWMGGWRRNPPISWTRSNRWESAQGPANCWASAQRGAQPAGRGPRPWAAPQASSPV